MRINNLVYNEKSDFQTFTSHLQAFYAYQVEKQKLHGYLYYYSKHGSFGQSLQLHPVPCKSIPLVIDARWQPPSWMHSFLSISLNLVFFCCFVEAPKVVKRKCFIQSQSCSSVRNLESNLEVLQHLTDSMVEHELWLCSFIACHLLCLHCISLCLNAVST